MSDILVVNEIYLSLQGESTFAGLPCIFVRLTGCDLRCSYCDTAYAFTEGKKISLADVIKEIGRLAAPFEKSPGVGAENDSKPRISASLQAAGQHQNWPVSADQKTYEQTVPYSGAIGRLPLIELTGGEPLLQSNSIPLMKACCDGGFTVLLETSGAHDLTPVDPRVHCIMDLKCPSSGEVQRNRWENIPLLKRIDEIKFVIGSVEDYEWAKDRISEHNLVSVCPLLFSWVSPLVAAQHHKTLKSIPAGQTPISRCELAERIVADALPVRFQIQIHKVIWSPEARGV